jgi:hypothetical protein
MSAMDELCTAGEQPVGKSVNLLAGENCPIRSTAAPQVVVPDCKTQACDAKGFSKLYSALKTSISYY